MVVRLRRRVRMPVGPLRHLVRRSDSVAFGVEADMAWRPQIGRS